MPIRKHIIRQPSKIANVIGLVNLPALNMSVGRSSINWRRKKMINMM
jgi:hypothetical protein